MDAIPRPPAACPRCRQPLSVDATDPSGLRCLACAGVFIPGASAGFDFLREDGATARPSTPESAEEAALPCPGCAGRLLAVPLGGTVILHCGSCGGRWIDAESAAAAEAAPPAAGGSLGWLMYGATLPERLARSSIGVAAGAARESAAWLVPKAFQDSKTYELVVHNSLRFLAEDIGGVASQTPAAATAASAEEFIARKAVGSFVELAGLATLHVSPVWLLAIVSDVAYGSKAYVHELAVELKKQGLIDETSTIGGIDDVLEAVRKASGDAATVFDTPPLSPDQLKESLDATRAAIASADYRRILPEAELRQYWQEMRDVATRENQSLLGVSGAVTMRTLGKVATVGRGTLTGVQVVGGLANRHVLGHYRESLATIRERGLYTTLRETAGPYIAAVGHNFAGDRTTWTEELVSGRMLKKGAATVAGWFRRRTPDDVRPGEAAD